ncbi:MAG: S41 family peptidase [Bryobacteraceae bacterium]|jgi:carboxyl-terminal processing protease
MRGPVSRVLLSAVLCLSSAAAQSHPAAAPSSDDLQSSLKKFTSFLDVVEQNFADSVDTDRAIYRGAIPTMLRTLDPHSTFFDPKAYQLLREDQAGHYFGVGMLVGAPEGKVIVMYPFQGSPAYKAGLRPGDTILSVNGASCVGLDIPAVSNMLKGPRGTRAHIEVARSGHDGALAFNVIRGEVERDSVTHSFWIQPGIAYIKVEGFNENTGHEFEKALNDLGEPNINGLVLDLRDNPGGILQEAVSVADHFLRKGQTIVTHHGRASEETTFTAKRGERGRQYPIVVVVNRSSASAAEILAGALQDHDRAWVLGENTFGKGLVQAPYPLSENTALLLTIARYYTPSGRLIQRDYEHRSFYEYYSRLDGHNNAKDMKKTDSGRTVYGGDGITPDERYEYPSLSAYESDISANLTMFFFATEYFGSHPASLDRHWKPNGELLADFRAFAAKRGFTATDSGYHADLDWIRERLREEMFVTAFSKEESEQVALENDPEIARALSAIPASRALLDKARQTMARKGGGKSAVEE